MTATTDDQSGQRHQIPPHRKRDLRVSKTDLRVFPHPAPSSIVGLPNRIWSKAFVSDPCLLVIS